MVRSSSPGLPERSRRRWRSTPSSVVEGTCCCWDCRCQYDPCQKVNMDPGSGPTRWWQVRVIAGLCLPHDVGRGLGGGCVRGKISVAPYLHLCPDRACFSHQIDAAFRNMIPLCRRRCAVHLHHRAQSRGGLPPARRNAPGAGGGEPPE